MVNEKYKKNSFSFIKVYSFMRDELKLKGLELDIYAYIFSQIELNDNDVISYGELSKNLHSARETIVRAINNLVKKELIVKCNGKTNSYSINLDGVLINNQQTLNQLLIKNQQNCLQKINSSVDKKSTAVLIKNQHIKNNKELKEYKEYINDYMNNENDNYQSYKTNEEDSDFTLWQKKKNLLKTKWLNLRSMEYGLNN